MRLKPVRLWFVLMALSGSWLAAAGQQPQLAPGSLDLTFGSDGWSIVDFDTLGDEPFGLGVLADGSILVGGEVTTRATGSGDFGILKLTAAGRPDPAFAAKGMAALDFDRSSGQVGRDLHVDAQGRIVLPGVHLDALAATRVLPSGRVDDTFGSNGLVTAADGTTQIAYAGAIDPGGRVAVIGQSDLTLAVAVFDAAGRRAADFGRNGLAVTPIAGFDEAVAQEVVFLPDGKLLVAGFIGGPATNAMLAVRFNRDGTLDRTFGRGAGYVVGTYGQLHEAQALAVLPDGKFLLAGLALSGRTKGFLVARHLADGTLDTSFGTKGYRFSTLMTEAHDIEVAPDGSFYVAGAVENLGRSAIAVAKQRPDGTMDAAFSGTGVAVFPSGRNHGVARRIAFHGPNGFVLAGSILAEGGHADFAVVRVRR